MLKYEGKNLFILVTLVFVIGFIIGMLTSAQIRNKKLQPVRMVLSEQRYVDDLYRIIEPSVDQINFFKDLVNKYGEIKRSTQQGVLGWNKFEYGGI